MPTKEYYQKNKEKIREQAKQYDKRYRQKNREKQRQTSKKYYEKNREEINAKRRLRWKTNHEYREKILTKQKEYQRKRYPKHKEYLKKYNKKRLEEWKDIFIEKYGKIQCSKCGYDKSFGSITFHHINGKQDKKYAPCYLFRLKPNPERIKELDKCIILCANCHFEETWGIIPI